MHQGRPGPRIAEQHDLFGHKLHADVAGGGSMIDTSEDRQSAQFDRLEEPGHRLRVAA
jgi:hypothetical protein